MFTLKVGEYTYGHDRLDIIAADDGEMHNIKIGKYCSLASNIKIYCGRFNHDYKKASTFPFKELCGANCSSNPWGKSDPIIGNDVWIGENSVILPGVEIGDGAVIASFSIVSKSVPPYAIMAGNPASIKKYRFEPKLIEELLLYKWWDVPHDYLLTNVVPYLEDVDLFLEKVKNYKNGRHNI